MPKPPARLLSRSLSLALACLLLPLAARADNASTNTPAITATPGSSGMFEISFQTTAVAATVTSFNLTLTATTTTATGLTFTGVTMMTTDPYIFAGVSQDVANGTPFSSSAFPNTSFAYMDADTNPGGFAVGTNSTFGLAEVSYTVAADATPGVYTLTTGGTVSTVDNNFVGMEPGTFTIVVPEPGSVALAGLGLATMGFWTVRRRLVG